MSSHAGPPDDSTPEPGDAPIPEPSYAERARTLVYVGRTGTLSTLSRKHPGHPFGSLMPYAIDDHGGPLLLISTLAVHTQNLQADPRASLLVTQPGWSGDPLAAGRATLMGRARRLSGEEAAVARPTYLARHPHAAYWVDFQDFAFYRLEPEDIYFVGGFAAMDWIAAEAYAAARPDPLADAAAGIVEHMNRDHPDALVLFARVLAGTEAGEAVMVAVDRLGFKLRIRRGDRVSSARIPFPREVATAQECRAVLIEMLRDARARFG
ncbi:MAG: HugZ family protein [Candidatus Rokubacteria bacterium]|nr:HugZ family protein [Candidatus Rokubacteria bacterium]